MFWAAPVLALAQTQTLEGVGAIVLTIIQSYVVPIIFAVAFVIFLLGVIKYISSGGDEGKRTEARNMIIYGIIALFVMSAVWGLVRLLSNTFRVGTGEGGGNIIPPLPN